MTPQGVAGRVLAGRAEFGHGVLPSIPGAVSR